MARTCDECFSDCDVALCNCGVDVCAQCRDPELNVCENCAFDIREDDAADEEDDADDADEEDEDDEDDEKALFEE